MLNVCFKPYRVPRSDQEEKSSTQSTQQIPTVNKDTFVQSMTIVKEFEKDTEVWMFGNANFINKLIYADVQLTLKLHKRPSPKVLHCKSFRIQLSNG